MGWGGVGWTSWLPSSTCTAPPVVRACRAPPRRQGLSVYPSRRARGEIAGQWEGGAHLVLQREERCEALPLVIPTIEQVSDLPVFVRAEKAMEAI